MWHIGSYSFSNETFTLPHGVLELMALDCWLESQNRILFAPINLPLILFLPFFFNFWTMKRTIKGLYVISEVIIDFYKNTSTLIRILSAKEIKCIRLDLSRRFLTRMPWAFDLIIYSCLERSMVQEYHKWCWNYLEEKDAGNVDVIENVFA